MKFGLLATTLIVLFAIPSFAQDEETSAPANSPTAKITFQNAAVKRSSLKLEFVKIRNQMLFHDIYSMVERIYGRKIAVQNSDSVKTSTIRNLQMFNGSIAIYDNSNMTKKIKKVIAQLDVLKRSQTTPSQELITAEYQPRFISVNDARSALEPFARFIVNGNPVNSRRSNQTQQSTRNVTTLDGRGILLIRDRTELVDKMIAVLKKVDQPKAQFLISCMLIQGDKDAADDRLARILPKELSSMSPHKKFKMISSGVIRVTAGSGRKVTLSMEGADSVKSWLSFIPTSFDPQTGTLGLDRINVEFEKTSRKRGKTRQSFETAASITKDDYVVIGAFGDNPVFAVLHLIQTK